jgi:hypothetical protein
MLFAQTRVVVVVVVVAVVAAVVIYARFPSRIDCNDALLLGHRIKDCIRRPQLSVK